MRSSRKPKYDCGIWATKTSKFRLGDGSQGWSEKAPFDGIIVTAGAPGDPGALKSQLSEGGRLVIPVGSRYSQNLLKVTRVKNRFEEEDLSGCVFVPLVGESGWKEGMKKKSRSRGPGRTVLLGNDGETVG